ncbi:hypothetical protein CsSME_00024461 [Camellia sinensis var. sinensis]
MVTESLMAMSFELYEQSKFEMIAKFEKLHPYKFFGGSNPYKAEVWPRQINKLLTLLTFRMNTIEGPWQHFKWKGKKTIGGK